MEQISVPKNENLTKQNPSILSMIFNPIEQFKRIKEQPKVLLAFMAILLSFAVGGILTVYNTDFSAAIPPGTDSDLHDGLVMAAMIMAVLSITFNPFLGVVLSSLVFLLILKIVRSDVTYKQLLSMNVYILFIGAVGVLLNGLIMFIVGGQPDQNYTSLSVLFDGKLWTAIEIFSIWQLVLTAIGLQIIGGASKVLSWSLVFIFFLLNFGVVYLGASI